MSPLAQLLQAEGFDCSSLQSLFKTDRTPTLLFRVPGGEAAVEAWKRLRDLVPKTGHWPVMLGREGDSSTLGADSDELADADGSVRDTLTHAEKIDGASWFAA